MKIATWNINSVRLRLDLIKKLKEEKDPDILCLQETKVINELFPENELKELGYNYLSYAGQKSYNGVAILSKKNVTNSFSLKLYNDDARHIAIKIDDIEIHNFYVPAGGDEPNIDINPKYKHKLEYIKLIQDWLIKNRKKTDKLILVGDLNIAPHENDVWSSKQLRNVVSHTEPEKKVLFELQNSLSFIDTARYFVNKEEKLYSWWSYRNKDWKKSNRGRRLDHIWTTPPLQKTLINIDHYKETRDWVKTSDHVPCILTINS